MKRFCKLLLLLSAVLVSAGCTFIPEVSPEEEDRPPEETSVPPAADAAAGQYTLTEIDIDMYICDSKDYK